MDLAAVPAALILVRADAWPRMGTFKHDYAAAMRCRAGCLHGRECRRRFAPPALHGCRASGDRAALLRGDHFGDRLENQAANVVAGKREGHIGLDEAFLRAAVEHAAIEGVGME